MKYTLVFIFNKRMNQVLLVNKQKGPYLNLINGVGGKLDPDASSPLYGALREVNEETGYAENDFSMFEQLMTVIYPSGTQLHIFYGVVNSSKSFEQKESEPLFWRNVSDVDDVWNNSWAGEGGPAYFIRASIEDYFTKR